MTKTGYTLVTVILGAALAFLLGCEDYEDVFDSDGSTIEGRAATCSNKWKKKTCAKIVSRGNCETMGHFCEKSCNRCSNDDDQDSDGDSDGGDSPTCSNKWKKKTCAKIVRGGNCETMGHFCEKSCNRCSSDDDDACPNNPNKTDPGECGCGVADTDIDKDGTADCKDGCPNDSQKTAPGKCGCGVAEGSCGGGGDGVTTGFVPCTRKPVGVPFPTPGGNASFGICKDGTPPSAWAQGVTIWDPNEGRSFTGNCQHIEQYAREGHLSNNMCAITRLRLDGICCSNPKCVIGDPCSKWTWH